MTKKTLERMKTRVPRSASFATLMASGMIFASASIAQVEGWRSEWPYTDFSVSAVDLTEIMSGGPPKDGIPALVAPEFIAAGAEARLAEREPVMTLEVAGQTPRAYPVRYLLWHEIVNDTVGDVPVAVTYCPLCNSGIFFDRRVNGELRTFGVSGKLRYSDMVMYDRETESWWQQAVGEGIVGYHAGDRLQTLPGWLESWAEFKSRNPAGLVMDEPKFPRRYGHNPYIGYDTARRPFLYSGEMPPVDILPLARVVRVGHRAWPLERLREAGELTEHGISFVWSKGQASPLDSALVGDGREVGTIRVKDAVSGEDLAHDTLFAFAYHAFFPEGEWILAPE